ncbi:MAG: DUF3754 domain-containing protein [Pseudomonadota bacterium]
MTDAAPAKDGYIAVRRSQLAAALTAHAGDPRLGDVLKVLSAILHYEAYDALNELKALYDPLDPDAPQPMRDTSAGAFERFETMLTQALKRANYAEIACDSLESRRATAFLTGLNIRASQAGIRRIRFFARGERQEMIERRSLFGLQRVSLDAQVFADVVVLVGFKADREISSEDKKAFSHMRRGMRPGAALVKHFRNVAHAELVTLHPGARPSMRPHDQVFLAAPAIAGGVPILLNLWPALTVLFAVLSAYFGARGVIEDSELKRALAAVSGLAAVGAFVMRQRMKYEAQTLRYQKQLSETVYFRNIANNAGVLDLLIGEGEDQDVKEALLGYAMLLAANKALQKDELDAAAEHFLRETLKLDIDFEIADALGKLERYGLVTREGEAYRAVDTVAALGKLDAAWDGYFSFAPTPA